MTTRGSRSKNDADQAHEEGDAVSPGDKLARSVATIIATLVGAAVVGIGAAIYNLGDNYSNIGARVTFLERESIELHGYIDRIHRRFEEYPSAVELGRCGQRVEKLEMYAELDRHRMTKLEASCENLEKGGG